MRRGLVWAAAALLSALAAVGVADAGNSRAHRHAPAHSARHGYDVSWPQCSGSRARHMPHGSPSYVILGLTNGSGHTVNPCLGSQLAWARAHRVRTGAYLVPTYPSRAQYRHARRAAHHRCARHKRCVLRKEGALQARDALATMRRTGLRTPRVWVDVEFRRYRPWTRSRRANAQVVRGVARTLRHSHTAAGVYSTSYMWHAIVGGYRLRVPNWLPVGHGGPHRALRMCHTTASGGVTWLAQYTRALDSDLACPLLGPVKGEHSSLWPFRNTTQQLLDTGRAVREIQRQLNVPVTGDYDPVTEAAVTRWQQNHGLDVTGRVTPVDWRALGAYDRHGGHGWLLGKFTGRS